MSANSQEIVLQIRTEFEVLLAEMLNTCPEQRRTAQQVERNLWQQMLTLGRSLMALFLVKPAETVAPHHVTTQKDQNVPSHDDKERTYHSVFGPIRFGHG